MSRKIRATLTALLLCQSGICAQDAFAAHNYGSGNVWLSAADQSVSALDAAVLSLTAYPVDPVFDFPNSDAGMPFNVGNKLDAPLLPLGALGSFIDGCDFNGVEPFSQTLSSPLPLTSCIVGGDSGNGPAGIKGNEDSLNRGVNWHWYHLSYLNIAALTSAGSNELRLLNNLAASSPLLQLASAGRGIVGTTDEVGMAVRMPLSIVNMPVTVGLTPKVQRLGSFNYTHNGSFFDGDDFDGKNFHREDTDFNLDAEIALTPMTGLSLALVGQNLLDHALAPVAAGGAAISYRTGTMVTLGLAYGDDSWRLATALELTDNEKFSGMDGSRFWRIGGEWQAVDWLELRLGFRQDLNHLRAESYSVGTGFSLGTLFKLDFSGTWDEKDALGAVLQSSYHF